MVVDTLENCSRYENLHPRFKAAFDFLRNPTVHTLTAGRTDIEGDALFAIVQDYETKPVSEGKLEAHRKYIDIQFVADGEELMGYAPLGRPKVVAAYDADKDVAFYEGESWFTLVRKGMFAIFFPLDAHLPSRHTGTPSRVKKVVLKIAVS
ncbi:MAG TPA: YhcH/YjgK/YiaL family protein [Kiritimatiellia bacterium]|nr:YhcH/YjgK/YiaL family protein [Kiritimatiellia bacterium]HRU71250.1 YhcH/YjgK/YiaL family protein [Kiritimatiellia bacterium]